MRGKQKTTRVNHENLKKKTINKQIRTLANTNGSNHIQDSGIGGINEEFIYFRVEISVSTEILRHIQHLTEQ